jgi:hypothetical protein
LKNCWRTIRGAGQMTTVPPRTTAPRPDSKGSNSTAVAGDDGARRERARALNRKRQARHRADQHDKLATYLVKLKQPVLQALIRCGMSAEATARRDLVARKLAVVLKEWASLVSSGELDEIFRNALRHNNPES